MKRRMILSLKKLRMKRQITTELLSSASSQVDRNLKPNGSDDCRSSWKEALERGGREMERGRDGDGEEEGVRGGSPMCL